MIDSARFYWDINMNPSYSWHTGHAQHLVDSHWSFLPIFEVESRGSYYVGGRFILDYPPKRVSEYQIWGNK